MLTAGPDPWPKTAARAIAGNAVGRSCHFIPVRERSGRLVRGRKAHSGCPVRYRMVQEQVTPKGTFTELSRDGKAKTPNTKLKTPNRPRYGDGQHRSPRSGISCPTRHGTRPFDRGAARVEWTARRRGQPRLARFIGSY